MTVVARTPEKDAGYYWYQLEDSGWIREDLVGNERFIAGLPSAVCNETDCSIQIVITGVDKREEVVAIANQGLCEVNLRGWTLVSERGNQACQLNADLLLQPGYTSGYSCF